MDSIYIIKIQFIEKIFHYCFDHLFLHILAFRIWILFSTAFQRHIISFALFICTSEACTPLSSFYPPPLFLQFFFLLPPLSSQFYFLLPPHPFFLYPPLTGAYTGFQPGGGKISRRARKKFFCPPLEFFGLKSQLTP